MRKMRMLVLALACSAFGATTHAHEGGVHSRGTVKEITADRIVLMTTEGKRVTLAIAAGTRIVRGHRRITTAEVHPGERAVVHAAARDGKLEATEVMVAEDVNRDDEREHSQQRPREP